MGDARLRLPDLHLSSSVLLKAAMDERFFRIWEFERDGVYDRHQAVKDEIERYVAAIERWNPASTLFAAADQDPPFMRGSTFRGSRPYSREEGTRPIAFRALELLLYACRQQLDATALRPPSRDDRVSRVVPGLFDALSPRDGLLPLRPEMIPDSFNHDRYLIFGDHALFPHPGIRGARELVGDLWQLTTAGADVRIAIDPNRVVHRDDAQDVLLLDYWFGVKITRAELDDLTAVGHTRHERRVDTQEMGAYPLIATDFWWHADGSTKVLKVEETVPRSSFEVAGGLVSNRFLHAIRDTVARRFVHVDGAIKAYHIGRYEADIHTPTASKGSDPLYRKMWRVEGAVSDAVWGRLVGHFFRDNELVIEYFGEALDERGDFTVG